MQTYWASQSPVTEPGPAAAAIDVLPADPVALREASSQLMFHYQTGGDFAANDVPASRMAEINTRYADAMFALLLGRASRRSRGAGRRPTGWSGAAGTRRCSSSRWPPGWMTHGPAAEADAATLDEVCAVTASPAVSPDAVAALAARDGLRVPHTVTRFDPHGAPPQQADVTRVLGRAAVSG